MLVSHTYRLIDVIDLTVQYAKVYELPDPLLGGLDVAFIPVTVGVNIVFIDALHVFDVRDKDFDCSVDPPAVRQKINPIYNIPLCIRLQCYE